MQGTFARCGALTTLLFIAALVGGGTSNAADVWPAPRPHMQAPVTMAGVAVNRDAVSQADQVTPMSTASTDDRRPVVIISDLNDLGDDSIAILMLLRSGQFDIRGIITTSGNVCASLGATEATRLVQSAGAASIPVVQGFPLSWHDERRRFYEDVERPSWRRRAYVGAFADPQSCAPSGAVETKIEASDFLIEQARVAKAGLTIILIGPATVLAEAMRKEPQLAGLIRRVYAMGGAIAAPGNVTEHAEFNVWFDPEAMAAVLASRVPMTLVPLDATAGVTYEQLPRPDKATHDFAASHLADYLARADTKGSPVRMWDEVLAAVVIDPTLVATGQEVYLSVSTARDDRYGKLLSSPVATDGTSRPVEVVTKVQADRVRQLVVELLLTGG